MILKTFRYFVILIGCFSAATAQSGTSGPLAFLKISPDARSAALGETGLSDSRGAFTLLHNPALMSYTERSAASFAYTDWLLDLTMQSGAILFKKPGYALGLSFTVLNTPDIELRTLPSDEPIETFSAHDLAAGVSFSYRLGTRLALGLTGKYLYQQIYVDDASGFAADLGIAYRFPVAGLTFGAAICNVGEMAALQQKKPTLPASVAFGAAGTILKRGDFGLQGTADARTYLEDDTRFHVGVEAYWQEHLFLRGGYQTGSELRTISGGAGLAWDRFTFDYAYQPLAEDFGAGHRIAFSLQF
jgi:hypothetical protein